MLHNRIRLPQLTGRGKRGSASIRRSIVIGTQLAYLAHTCAMFAHFVPAGLVALGRRLRLVVMVAA
jgi:hypothetical protein